MQIGSLDRRIVIQSPTNSKNAAGGLVQSWSDVRTVWARKLDPSGSEKWVQFAERSFIIQEWVIAYMAGIENTYRVTYQGGIYLVRSVTELGRREYLKLGTEQIK